MCANLGDPPANVSTHSRPKAAAYIYAGEDLPVSVSTHSRPKAAAKFKVNYRDVYIVSTHSRPKAAANPITIYHPKMPCFNTQPPEGGCA